MPSNTVTRKELREVYFFLFKLFIQRTQQASSPTKRKLFAKLAVGDGIKLKLPPFSFVSTVSDRK